MILMLLIAAAQIGEADGKIEVDAGAPVVLRSDVETPEGWSALSEWRASIPKPGGVREFDGGRSLAIWAPPGKHEITLSVVLAKVEQNKIIFDKQTRVWILSVRGPQPPPTPGPTPDPTPPGQVARIVIVTDETDTPAESRKVLAARNGPRRSILLVLGRRQAGDKYPSGGAEYYPHFFSLDAAGKVISHGHVDELQ